MALSGQRLEVGPRVAVGDGSAFTVQAGLRAEALFTRWGAYAAGGIRVATSVCAGDFCPLPTAPAWSVMAGLIGTEPGTPFYYSLGAGATRWDGATDPTLEGEVGLRFPVFRALKTGVGMHMVIIPSVERPGATKKDVHFVELVLGITVGVGRPRAAR